MLNPDPQSCLSAWDELTSPDILVLGDLMLDRYSWGTVERISPEAPIPVLRLVREEERLGGGWERCDEPEDTGLQGDSLRFDR